VFDGGIAAVKHTFSLIPCERRAPKVGMHPSRRVISDQKTRFCLDNPRAHLPIVSFRAADGRPKVSLDESVDVSVEHSRRIAHLEVRSMIFDHLVRV
jgi:hypothetical protein